MMWVEHCEKIEILSDISQMDGQISALARKVFASKKKNDANKMK